MCYKTIKDFATDEFVEKKSRFIGYASPVSSTQQAQDFINFIVKKEHDATHNCYAYCLLSGEKKCYDDGEPSQTAGVPILGVIEKANLADICIVVTRYFGKILLGGGGLVRAYSNGASIAIKKAEIITKSLCVEFQVTINYTLYGKLSKELEKFSIEILNSEFLEDVTLTILTEQSEFEKLIALITEISNGRAIIKQNSIYYAEI